MAVKKDKPFSQTAFFIFAFIPCLQWIACFIMNGHVRRKRYLIMGFVNICLIIALIFIPMFAESYAFENLMRYPKAPAESDYWGKSYDDFRVDGQIDWDAYDKASAEWRKSPEYKEYAKALEDYYNSEEYKIAYNNNQNLHTFENTVSFICTGMGFILYIVYMVLIFFVERYKYLDALNGRGNSDAAEVMKTLNTNKRAQNTTKNRTKRKANNDVITHENKEVANVIPDVAEGALNVNLASEAEIEALPLVNIVDAKKIISYREAHGEFKDIDEFFQVFNAKPHVIVKLQDKVTVESNIINNKITETTAKKRFDL